LEQICTEKYVSVFSPLAHHRATLRSHRGTIFPVTCFTKFFNNHGTLLLHRGTISPKPDFKLTLTIELIQSMGVNLSIVRKIQWSKMAGNKNLTRISQFLMAKTRKDGSYRWMWSLQSMMCVNKSLMTWNPFQQMLQMCREIRIRTRRRKTTKHCFSFIDVLMQMCLRRLQNLPIRRMLGISCWKAMEVK